MRIGRVAGRKGWGTHDIAEMKTRQEHRNCGLNSICVDSTLLTNGLVAEPLKRRQARLKVARYAERVDGLPATRSSAGWADDIDSPARDG